MFSTRKKNKSEEEEYSSEVSRDQSEENLENDQDNVLKKNLKNEFLKIFFGKDNEKEVCKHLELFLEVQEKMTNLNDEDGEIEEQWIKLSDLIESKISATEQIKLGEIIKKQAKLTRLEAELVVIGEQNAQIEQPPKQYFY